MVPHSAAGATLAHLSAFVKGVALMATLRPTAGDATTQDGTPAATTAIAIQETAPCHTQHRSPLHRNTNFPNHQPNRHLLHNLQQYLSFASHHLQYPHLCRMQILFPLLSKSTMSRALTCLPLLAHKSTPALSCHQHLMHNQVMHLRAGSDYPSHSQRRLPIGSDASTVNCVVSCGTQVAHTSSFHRLSLRV